MHSRYILKSLGILLSIFSLTMLPPMIVAIWYKEVGTLPVFMLSGLFILTIGLSLWFPVRNTLEQPQNKDGFLIVFVFWLTLCLVSSVPFMLSPEPHISWVDAIFEAISGITATGATILTGLEELPRSILYYRQQLQFLGGMGVILLAIAILPTLGVGGMQLFSAEMTGPSKNAKLTPKIAQTAKALWMIYVGLTVFCAISYWAAGMDLFDAIGISFGTVSTGGYCTHDQSFGFFQNQMIQIIAIVFMLLGATSFTLHYIATNYATIRHYFKNLELKFYLAIILVASLLCGYVLWKAGEFSSIKTTFLESLFHIVSFSTTTGFSSSSYSSWPLFIPILLILLGLVGGCAGSTSGGIKMIRVLLLYKQGVRETDRLIHPSAHFTIKFGQTPLSDRIINAIWGFIATYMALFGIILLLLLATGLDFITSYSATTACLSNVGAALGDVSKNYQELSNFAKMLLSFAMVTGRLELFTVLVLFSPTYWKS